MRELAFVGLSDDGTALVLSGPDGTRYTVPCDDRLETAMRRDRSRLGQMEIALDGTTPKDIQQRVRFGQTPEEISESSGIPLERVLRFAGPVIAERQHIAAQAIEVELRDGGTSRTLGATVLDQLALGGADPELVEWDAWRREDGRWSLLASWEPVESVALGATAALWAFDPLGRTIVADDPASGWLLGERPALDPEADDTETRPHLVGLPSHDELDAWDDDSVDPDAAFTAIVERDSGAEVLDLVDRPRSNPTTTRRSTTSTTRCPGSPGPRARSRAANVARPPARRRPPWATWRRAARRGPPCRAGTRSCSARATPRAEPRRSAAVGTGGDRTRRVRDPLRPRPGIEPGVDPEQRQREHRVRRHHPRAARHRDRGARVHPEGGVPGGQTLRREEPTLRVDVVVRRGADRTRDVPGHPVDRLGLPAIARTGAHIEQGAVDGVRRGLVGVEHGRSGDVGGEPGATRGSVVVVRRTLVAGDDRSPGVAPRRETAVEQPDVVVAVVPQQPPGPGGHRAVAPVGDDDAAVERDAGASHRGGEPGRVGQRMTSA